VGKKLRILICLQKQPFKINLDKKSEDQKGWVAKTSLDQINHASVPLNGINPTYCGVHNIALGLQEQLDILQGPRVGLTNMVHLN
jgi:hypothetical protein